VNKQFKIQIKMKKFFMMMGLVALVTVTMTSCMHVKVGDKDWSLGSLGSGHKNDTPTQVHQVGQETVMQTFDGVNVCGPFNIILEQGEGHNVRVDGTTEQLEKITIYVKGDELFIDQREEKWNSNDFKGMRIFVTATTVKDIVIAGSGTLTAPQALTVADLDLEVAGSGNITIAQLMCQDLHVEIAGSGNVTTGPIQAREVKNEIAGSGDIDFAGLTCLKLYNEIAGSGDITLNNLNVDNVSSDIAGSGDIILRGRVGTHKEDIAGSGKVDVSGLTAPDAIK